MQNTRLDSKDCDPKDCKVCYKLGHKRLRKSLYMPALVAIRHNPVLKAVYERLVNNGKPKKVAIIAVMRKLLILSYGVLKSEKPFDINYQMTD